MLKTFTIDDIRAWNPCYDPAKHLPENWIGSASDILRHDTIPPRDKLWVVCREELIDAKTLRLFAVWCARQVEHLLTDQRSNDVLIVAEKFANGTATTSELAAARAAAWVAARDVARDARAAARDAAWAAAWVAARDAAWAAAWVAADAARDVAADAAADAAWAAVWDAQINQLIKMITEQQGETCLKNWITRQGYGTNSLKRITAKIITAVTAVAGTSKLLTMKGIRPDSLRRTAK